MSSTESVQTSYTKSFESNSKPASFHFFFVFVRKTIGGASSNITLLTSVIPNDPIFLLPNSLPIVLLPFVSTFCSQQIFNMLSIHLFPYGSINCFQLTPRIFVFDFILMFIRCKQRDCICLTGARRETLKPNGSKKNWSNFQKNYSKWVYGILSVNHYPNSRKKSYIVCSMPRITISFERISRTKFQL